MRQYGGGIGVSDKCKWIHFATNSGSARVPPAVSCVWLYAVKCRLSKTTDPNSSFSGEARSNASNAGAVFIRMIALYERIPVDARDFPVFNRQITLPFHFTAFYGKP